MESDAGDVALVTFKREERVGVGRLDIEEFDRVVACSGEEAFVWRNTEAVNLGVRMLNRAGTDS